MHSSLRNQKTSKSLPKNLSTDYLQATMEYSPICLIGIRKSLSASKNFRLSSISLMQNLIETQE